MFPRVHFVIIFLHLQVLITNGLPENDFVDTKRSTSIKTDVLNSTMPSSCPACPSNRCSRKCCSATEVYDSLKGCLPDIHNKLQNATGSVQFSTFETLSKINCPSGYQIPVKKVDSCQLFSNGSIYAFETLISFNQYCEDYATEDGSIRPVVCYDETFYKYKRIEEDRFPVSLYSIGFGISNLFLIITLGLYLLTPELRKKVYDKCFLCHLSSLVIGFTSLIGVQNITVENSACAFLGYTTQFWLLATLFWLNIMCIDMLRSLSNVQTLEKSNVRKLLTYCLYAWGCPSLILIFTLLADHFLPSNHPMRTGIAEETCWIKQNKGNESWLDRRTIYFYSFISVTLLVNIYTFVRTALLIKFQNKRWKEKNNGESRRHKLHKNRIILYLKLFVVTGLYWVMEVISYHFASVNAVWVTIDLIISLQGVFIFIIFICNKRALMILNKRFFPRKVFLK